MLANYSMKPLQTSVKFTSPSEGEVGPKGRMRVRGTVCNVADAPFESGVCPRFSRVAIYRPFEKVQHAKLPAKVRVEGERFAVVVEE